MANHKKKDDRSLLAQKDATISRIQSEKARLLVTLGEAVAENKRLQALLDKHMPTANQVIKKGAEELLPLKYPELLPPVENPPRHGRELAIATKAQPPTKPSKGLPTPKKIASIAQPFPTSIEQLNRTKAPPLITNEKNLFFRGFHITDEQQHSVDFVVGGSSLKVDAGAGSGKTTALAAMSNELSSSRFGYKRGLYLAFNKDIVLDAKKVFNEKTRCSTNHGLAFSAVGADFANRGRLEGRLTSDAVVSVLKLKDYHHINAWVVGALLIAWVGKFCQGSDDFIGSSSSSIPWDFLKTLTLEGDKRKAFELGQAYVKDLAPLAAKLWDHLIDPRGVLPITHDVYLKLWALGNPILPVDYILFDEAQDAAGVMMKLVHDQQAQKVWVGDKRQQIYSWRGAINAMDKIKTDHVSSLTRSFRYGQPIAELANSVLRNFLGEHEFAMVGSPLVESRIQRIDAPDAYLCRTNRSCVAELMRALQHGKRVYIAGGVADLLSDIESADALMSGRRPRSAAFQVFPTWGALLEYSETPAGGDLKPLIKMIDQWGVQTLRVALGKTSGIKESSADLVIATTHKVKGREYPRVKLSDDFVFPSNLKHECKTAFTDEEAHLLYVALTRAKYELDISNCTAAMVALEGND